MSRLILNDVLSAPTSHQSERGTGEQSKPYFEDQIERSLGGPSEVVESSLAEHLGQARLARLRTQHEFSAFGDRVRTADQRRTGVIQLPYRRKVSLDSIIRERFDQHHRATRCQHLGRM